MTTPKTAEEWANWFWDNPRSGSVELWELIHGICDETLREAEGVCRNWKPPESPLGLGREVAVTIAAEATANELATAIRALREKGKP